MKIIVAPAEDAPGTLQHGEAMQVLINDPYHPFVLLATRDGEVRQITAGQAWDHVMSGKVFGYTGNGRRLTAIIEIGSRMPLAKWRKCYQTTEAPVLPISPEWQHRMGYRVGYGANLDSFAAI